MTNYLLQISRRLLTYFAILAVLSMLALLNACQKEVEMTQAGTMTDSCWVMRVEQGTEKDTVSTLYYDSDGRIAKITEYDKTSNFTDSIIFTYNADGFPVKMLAQSPAPFYQEITYQNGKPSRILVIDPIWADTAEYAYEYSGNFEHPIRKNEYVHTPAPLLYSYFTYEYNANGDIARRKHFWDDGSLIETIDMTYTSRPNILTQIGAASEFINTYDVHGSMFEEAWWNKHDLESLVKTYPGGDAIQANMHYDLDSTGKVSGMQSTVSAIASDPYIYHYYFTHQCK